MSGKISEMDAASALSGGELLEVVQGGGNKKATVDQLRFAPGTYRTLSVANINSPTELDAIDPVADKGPTFALCIHTGHEDQANLYSFRAGVLLGDLDGYTRENTAATGTWVAIGGRRVYGEHEINSALLVTDTGEVQLLSQDGIYPALQTENSQNRIKIGPGLANGYETVLHDNDGWIATTTVIAAASLTHLIGGYDGVNRPSAGAKTIGRVEFDDFKKAAGEAPYVFNGDYNEFTGGNYAYGLYIFTDSTSRTLTLNHSKRGITAVERAKGSAVMVCNAGTAILKISFDGATSPLGATSPTDIGVEMLPPGHRVLLSVDADSTTYGWRVVQDSARFTGRAWREGMYDFIPNEFTWTSRINGGGLAPVLTDNSFPAGMEGGIGAYRLAVTDVVTPDKAGVQRSASTSGGELSLASNGNAWFGRWQFRVGTNDINNGTDQRSFFIGLMNPITNTGTIEAAITRGMYFRYSQADGANWIAVVRHSGGVATIDTGVAVTAFAWVDLDVMFYNDGTNQEVRFYINRVLVASFVSSTTTFDLANFYTPAAHTVKTLGTGLKYLYLDFVYERLIPPSRRG